MKPKITKINAKSVLQKSKLPESDYCINPYIGCSHQCIYCYARFMGRFTGHAKDKWGEYVDVRINSPELLRAEIGKMKSREGIFFLGSVTDIYQPIEKEYGITRELLKILSEYDVYTVFQTKSSLVLRDIDILSKFNRVEVGFTITTVNDEIRRIFEPFSSNTKSRLEALEKLKEAGIKTYAFIGPIIPELTDLEMIMNKIRNCVDYVMGESLNIRCGNWNDIEDAIKCNFPEIKPALYKQMINNTQYWSIVENDFRKLCDKYSIRFEGFFNHQKDKKKNN